MAAPSHGLAVGEFVIGTMQFGLAVNHRCSVLQQKKTCCLMAEKKTLQTKKNTPKKSLQTYIPNTANMLDIASHL